MHRDQSWLPPQEPHVLDTALVDVRGEHSFVLRSDGEQYVSCYLETTVESERTHSSGAGERLGHASIAITLDSYSHVLPKMDEAAAATFGAMLHELPAKDAL